LSSEVKLPERYSEPWQAAFQEQALRAAGPNCRILDIGSGRSPSLPRNMLPPGGHYAGFDLSLQELEKAPDGSYDEIIVGDVAITNDLLIGKYDLAVSWCVLEHVSDLAATISNIRLYLKPGGVFVTQFSGKFSAHGIVNMILPVNVGRWFLKRLLHRDLEKVFPAYYDACYYSKLLDITSQWDKVEITPRYRGASYFMFSNIMLELYVRYEDYIRKNDFRNMATHYLIICRK